MCCDRDGDSYIVSGQKWWTSGAPDPRCKIAIFMGKTDPSAATHKQQSMILVPMDAPGVRVIRPLNVYGYDDAPHGHAEMAFQVSCYACRSQTSRVPGVCVGFLVCACLCVPMCLGSTIALCAGMGIMIGVQFTGVICGSQQGCHHAGKHVLTKLWFLLCDCSC